MAQLKHIFLSVLLVVIAELSLKAGVKDLIFSKDNLLQFFISAITNPFVLFGLLLIGISSVIWIVALSRTELSYAYPFVSVGYITTAILSVLLFNEPSSVVKWIGIAVIVSGVIILSRS